MKKKLSIGLAIMLTLVFTAFGLYSMNKAYAAGNEDYVIGTSNLNGTKENSAKIGDLLKNPEKGWKRYDDSNSKIVYNGDMKVVKNYNYYNSQITNVYNAGDTMKFKFYGSKIRIMTDGNVDKPKTVNINIDGEDYNYSQQDNSAKHTRLSFEKLGLDLGVHEVVITAVEKRIVNSLDAIDIDEDGELHPYDVQAESITLDKTAIDLLKGNTDKLTAAVLPENASNKKVVWSSSDETIATVDQEGNVTAVKSGQADIIAKVDGTDLSATCKVIVTEKEPEPEPTPGKAILSISLVDGKTKDYDLSMEEVNKFINWYETKGSSTYKFDKNISPYKAVKEYIVHDKITSFEVREYE